MNNLQANAIGDAITSDCTSVNFMTNKNNCFLTGYFNEDMKSYRLETWAYAAQGGLMTIGTTGGVVKGARLGYTTKDITNDNEGQVITIGAALVV